MKKLFKWSCVWMLAIPSGICLAVVALIAAASS